jgi:hypothetical protein
MPYVIRSREYKPHGIYELLLPDGFAISKCCIGRARSMGFCRGLWLSIIQAAGDAWIVCV